MTIRSLASGPSAGAICKMEGACERGSPSLSSPHYAICPLQGGGNQLSATSGAHPSIWGVKPVLGCCAPAASLQPPAMGTRAESCGEGARWQQHPSFGAPLLPHLVRSRPGTRPQLTLMEAPANRASCLMCCPFFPMMAPTACVGMNKLTTSCSGSWRGEQSEGFSLILSFSLSPLPSAPPQALKSPARCATPNSIPALGTAGRGHPTGDAGGGGLTGCWCGKAPTGEAPYSPERYAEELCGGKRG